MNIKDQLQAIATTNGWTFDYGRSDYHNLKDAKAFQDDGIEGYSNDESILFLDPVTITSNESELITSAGRMMILTRSNHDKEYSDRYDLFIEPLITESKSMKNQLRCSFNIQRWEVQEVINFFDYNADGIIINFSMTGYE